LFTAIWDIPSVKDHVDSAGRPDAVRSDNQFYRRMIDCEIVLRFFAFRKRSRIKGSVRKILDSCMKDFKDQTTTQVQPLEREYLERLGIAHEVFAERTFRYQDQNGDWRVSQPLYDGVMLAVDTLWPHRDQLKAKKKAVVKAVSSLFKDEDAFAIIVGRPNTARAIHDRIDLVRKTISNAAGL
jgi:hypothetical protein